MTEGSSRSDDGLVTLDIAKIVHGGHCLGYEPDTAASGTFFVRHAIPGEIVRARVTGRSAKVIRADAIEVIKPSPHRVSPPCAFSGPGLCGGCDFQHVSLDHQRVLKEEVLRESMDRFAGLDSLPDCTVQALSAEGLGWRSRVAYAQAPSGEWGLRVHHAHDVLAVSRCLIAAPGADVPGPGIATLTPEVLGRTWRIPPGVFWQPHRLAAPALVACVMDFAQPRAGEVWWDLYAGAGLFTAFLGEAVGADGSVHAVEASGAAVKAARRALHDLPKAHLHEQDVGPWLAQQTQAAADGVVLDPPRAGAKERVLRGIVSAGPRVIVYVACDPVALARDTGYLVGQGYRLDAVRAFDAFPMTHHFETVARFTLASPPG